MPPVRTTNKRTPALCSSVIFLTIVDPLPVTSSNSIPNRRSNVSFNAFLNSAPGGTETTTLPSFLAAAMTRCHSACQSEVGLSAALPDVESTRRATTTVVVLVMKPFVQHRPVVGHPLIATHVFER